jgi:hypothetical protein
MDLQDAIRWLAEATSVQEPKASSLYEQYIRASQEWEAGEIKRLTDLNEEMERQWSFWGAPDAPFGSSLVGETGVEHEDSVMLLGAAFGK